MKSIRAILLLLAMSVSLTACGKESVPNNESPPPSMSSTEPEQKAVSPENSNIRIAYFSVPEDVDTTGVDAIAGASVVISEGEKLGKTQMPIRSLSRILIILTSMKLSCWAIQTGGEICPSRYTPS